MVLAATSSNSERRQPGLDESILGGSDPGQMSWSQPFSGSSALHSAGSNTRNRDICGCCSSSPWTGWFG